MSPLPYILLLITHMLMLLIGVYLGYNLHKEKHIDNIIDTTTKKLPVVREKISPELRRKVFERDAYTCLECGFTNCCSWHIGHVQPIAMGGNNNINNLYTSCASCNLRRGKKPFTGSLVETVVRRKV